MRGRCVSSRRARDVRRRQRLYGRHLQRDERVYLHRQYGSVRRRKYVHHRRYLRVRDLHRGTGPRLRRRRRLYSGKLRRDPGLRARSDSGLRRRRSRYVGLDRLAISPQCGFASSVGGNPVTEADQRAKLQLVADVAADVWG